MAAEDSPLGLVRVAHILRTLRAMSASVTAEVKEF